MHMRDSVSKLLKRAFFACAALLTVACQETVADRIAANPYLFNNLPLEHRNLVQQGRICSGMSQEAVQLAWGKPSRTERGQQGGRYFDRWVYIHQEPVTQTHWGMGYGHYHHHGHHHHYSHLSPQYETIYVPRVVGEVDFQDNAVTDWSGEGKF